MKKRFMIFLMLFCMWVVLPVYAGPEGVEGASPTAYEHASEESVFDRVSDWFATVGKPKEEQDRILAERRAERMAKKAEKEIKKASDEMQEAGQEIEEAGKDLGEKVDEMAEEKNY